MADENKSPSVDLRTVLLVVALVGGAYLIPPILQSSRPAAKEALERTAVGDQVVRARLWQDPLQVTLDYREQSKEKQGKEAEVSSHRLEELADQIKRRLKAQDSAGRPVAVFEVMMSGGSYAEDAELRRRSRYAALAALSVGGYVPWDAEHLGYTETDWPRGNFFEQLQNDKEIAPLEATPKAGNGQLIVPFEWFIPGQNATASKYGAVVLLWLNDDAFADHPAKRLAQLNRALEATNRTDRVQFKLIDPRLQALLNEEFKVARAGIGDSNSVPKELAGIELYSSWSTTADALLTTNSDGARRTEVADRLREAWGANFVNATCTDDELAEELIDELALRGADVVTRKDAIALVSEWDTFYGRSLPITLAAVVKRRMNDRFSASSLKTNLTAPQLLAGPVTNAVWRQVQPGLSNSISGVSNPTELTARMAKQFDRLVAGRSLPYGKVSGGREETKRLLTARTNISMFSNAKWIRLNRLLLEEAFPAAIIPNRLDDVVRTITTRTNEWPPNLVRFTYLRGVDGKIPGETPAEQGAAEKDQKGDSDKRAQETPRPEGPSQMDYLPRLANRIEAWEKYYNKSQGELKAIGVLGSDVYDKLVVLQLLRPRFTDEFFFTTDLDARLFHPAELKWTRNVLVASSFGLQLEHDLQKDIPPFRDTYQAGEYLACLAALDYRNTRTNLNFITPRLFEIGRRGPYDLSISTSPIHPRPPWQRRKAFLDDFPFGAVLLVSVGGVILALYVLAWKTHTRSSKCSTEVLSVNDIDLRELALKLDEPATPEAASGRRLCAELSQRSIEFLNRFGTSHPQRKPHPGDLPEDLPDDLPRRTEFVRDLNKILRTIEPDSAETGDPERKSEPNGAAPADTARYQRNRHALEKMCPLGIAQQPHHPRWTIRACLIWLLVLALIGLVLFLDHFTPGGQPFAWNEGLSVGPTELIRALAAGLACIWFFRSRSELLERKEKFVHDFGLPAITTGKIVKELRERKAARELRERSEGRRLPASRLGRAAAWLQRRFPATWRVLSYLFWIRIGKWEPVRAPSADDKEPMVDGVELFKQYNFLGYWRHRVYRLVFPVAVYLLFSFALLLLSEQPFRPYRGAVILWLDHSLIVLTVFWQTVLIFFVVDAVHLCHQLIDNLIEGPVHWPAATWRIFEAKLGVPREYLGEYITIQVIANRTDAVGRLIFYPFVVLFLTIVSRSSYFDRFDWPIGIVLIYGLASLLAVCAVWQLRAAAEKARKVALAGLNEKLLRALAGKQPAGGPQDLAAKRGQEVKGEKLKVADQKESDKSDPVEQIRVLLDEIRSCEKGAFAPITQQPVIKGLLLPASGAGLASLLEYLSALQ